MVESAYGEDMSEEIPAKLAAEIERQLPDAAMQNAVTVDLLRRVVWAIADYTIGGDRLPTTIQEEASMLIECAVGMLPTLETGAVN
jgi:hypothetical protein